MHYRSSRRIAQSAFGGSFKAWQTFKPLVRQLSKLLGYAIPDDDDCKDADAEPTVAPRGGFGPKGWVHAGAKAILNHQQYFDSVHISPAHCSEWVPISRGQPLPEAAVKSGSTEGDGDLYVARNGAGEPGKLNLQDNTMWNIWCHDGGQAQQGDILVHKKGRLAWMNVSRGDPLPFGAVFGGVSTSDGSGGTYVARVDGACGKLNIQDAKVYNIWVHGSRLASKAGEVLVISPYWEWVPVMRGQALPTDAVKAGNTEGDGDVYVARNSDLEAGKLNVDQGKVWNIWCHGGGSTQVGDVLVMKTGGKAEWRRINSGDSIPDSAIFAGVSSTDGPGGTYVARESGGACGKLNVEGGNAHNIWIHGSHFPTRVGEVLLITAQEV